MDTIVGKFINVWLHPWAAMAYVKEQGQDASIKSSMIFVIIMGIISGVITAVAGMIVPPAGGLPKTVVWLAVLLVPVVSFIGSFIGAFILWALVNGLLMGDLPQYKTSYRLLALLAAFSPVSALLQPIPVAGQWLAIVINIWAIVVMIRGIIIIMDTKPLRTWVACGVFFGFLFILGIAARFAAQRGGLTPGGPFSDLPGATGTGDLGDADLDRELEELATKAKEEPKK